jgi:hypothetical protein
MAATSIYPRNYTWRELRAQIESGTEKGGLFSVCIGRKAEREAVAALVNGGAQPKFRIVTFCGEQVQLERIG